MQNLKDAIEKRLAFMIAQNPLRTDFQQHYEKLVAGYNQEKDRVTIEQGSVRGKSLEPGLHAS